MDNSELKRQLSGLLGMYNNRERLVETMEELLDKLRGNITNCVFIGNNAGINLTKGKNIVIIGDDIKDLSRDQENVLFIGKVAIGTHIGGKEINLKEVLEDILKSNK